MNKKLLFRADGDAKTGLGHVYRLLSLVEIFKKEYDCLFITKNNTPDSIFGNKYSVEKIPQNISIEEEVTWIAKSFSPENHIIICDGYQFVTAYQKRIKKKGYTLIYIDDLMSEYMYADLVINHSPEIDSKNYQTKNYTKLALGTKYALLRPEFLSQLNKSYKTIKEKNVFVCFGGADPFKFSSKTVESLLKIDEVKNIFVIIGAANNDKNLLEFYKSNPDKIKLYKNLNAQELLNIMLASQFAIVSSSTILFELCCSNTICLSGYYVDNQKRIHEGFLKNKAIYSLGNISEFKTEDFGPKIFEMLSLENHEEQLIHQKKMFDKNIESRYLKIIKDLC